MKNLFLFLILLLCCCFSCSNDANQKTDTASTTTVTTPKVQDWETFWKNFQSAVEKNDTESVATMTDFPLLTGGAWSESGEPKLQQSVFIKQFPIIFSKEIKEKIKAAVATNWSTLTVVDGQQARMMNAPVGASIRSLSLLFVFDEGTDQQTESSQILNFTKKGEKYKLCSIMVAG